MVFGAERKLTLLEIIIQRISRDGEVSKKVIFFTDSIKDTECCGYFLNLRLTMKIALLHPGFLRNLQKNLTKDSPY